MISCESVLNREYNFARVCPNYKQGIACPKQGNKIELVVLNRVRILGFFCPKQGQGFKLSAAHLYPNMGRVPPLANPALYNEVLRIANDLFQPIISVMYGKEPRSNKPSI